jgi:hypothetical protein
LKEEEMQGRCEETTRETGIKRRGGNRKGNGDVASKKTFLVNVLGLQNATWQGTITLIDKDATHPVNFPHVVRGGGKRETLADSKETMPFRSALEMITLIDGALEAGEPD